MVGLMGRLRRGLLLGLYGVALGGLGTAYAQLAEAQACQPATNPPVLVPAAQVRFCFAQLEFAQALLSAHDEWVDRTSPFHRDATVGVAGADAAVLKAHMRGTALEWTAPELQRWQRALDRLVPQLTRHGITLPAQVVLVKTDGRDSANAPYTRGSAVFIPERFFLNWTDAEFLAHEVFHIASRHNPKLADSVYALFGFEPVEPLEWPAVWQRTAIANPDTPFDRHAVTLDQNGQKTHWMPVLVAGRTTLQPGENFFSVLEVRLLRVEPGQGGQRTRAAFKPGSNGQEPIWVPAEESLAYLAALGGNTEYIFHAEETAADNFAFLTSGRKVRNPELTARLAKALAELARKP